MRAFPFPPPVLIIKHYPTYCYPLEKERQLVTESWIVCLPGLESWSALRLTFRLSSEFCPRNLFPGPDVLGVCALHLVVCTAHLIESSNNSVIDSYYSQQSFD